MRILIVGGAGFIGRWLLRELVKEHDVISIDPKPFSEEVLDFIGGRFTAYNMTWQDYLAFCDFPDVDVVVPLQGQIGSVDSVRKPFESLHESVSTNLSVLEHLRLMSRKPLIVFVSSDLCYSPEPKCLYSLHKHTVEGYLRIFYEIAGIPYVILRTATCYGPWQVRDSVVNFYIRRALNGDGIPVYGDGQNRQAFIYIEDAVNCIKMACEGKFGYNATYPLVGENLRITEIAEAVSRLIGGEVEHVDWPMLTKAVNVGDLPITSLGPHGWLPKVHFEGGILRTAEWIKKTF